MGGRSRSMYLFIRKVMRHCSNYRGMPLLSTTNKILINFLLSRSTPLYYKKSRIKLSTLSCLEIRMQDEAILQRFITVSLKGWSSLNISEHLKKSKFKKKLRAD